MHVEESELEVAMATEAQADMMLDDASGDSTDNDDFCILEAPGMGIPVSLLIVIAATDMTRYASLTHILSWSQPKDGEPVVTVLSTGPIKVKDSHFSRPRGSSDLLRAPSHFPVPQSRVVLREISVVWHLYGGKDFGSKPMSAHIQHANR